MNKVIIGRYFHEEVINIVTWLIIDKTILNQIFSSSVILFNVLIHCFLVTPRGQGSLIYKSPNWKFQNLPMNLGSRLLIGLYRRPWRWNTFGNSSGIVGSLKMKKEYGMWTIWSCTRDHAYTKLVTYFTCIILFSVLCRW